MRVLHLRLDPMKLGLIRVQLGARDDHLVQCFWDQGLQSQCFASRVHVPAAHVQVAAELFPRWQLLPQRGHTGTALRCGVTARFCRENLRCVATPLGC